MSRRASHLPSEVLALRRARRILGLLARELFFFLFYFCFRFAFVRLDRRERRDGGLRVESVEPHDREPLVFRQSHAVRRRAEIPVRDALEGVADDDGDRREGTERGPQKKRLRLAPRPRAVAKKKTGRVLVQKRETLEVGVLGDAHRARAGTAFSRRRFLFLSLRGTSGTGANVFARVFVVVVVVVVVNVVRAFRLASFFFRASPRVSWLVFLFLEPE